MKHKVVSFNETAVRHVPLDSGLWKIDAPIRGFYLNCRKKTATYALQRTVKGREVRTTLGHRFEITVKQAFQLALETLADRRLPGTGITLRQAYDEYMRTRTLRPRTAGTYQYSFESYVPTSLQNRRLADIERLELKRLHERITNERGWAQANQALRLIRAVYNDARRDDATLPENPTVAVRWNPAKRRDSALSDQELREWWKAVQKLTPVKKMYWTAVLLTGQRRTQLASAEWDHLFLDDRPTWRFPEANVKMGQEYVIPIAEVLAERLREHKQTFGDSQFVFPSPNRPRRPIASPRDDVRGLSHSAHALRHTWKTRSVSLIPELHGKLLLGHKATDVSGGYITRNNTELIEGLRESAENMARHYGSILNWC